MIKSLAWKNSLEAGKISTPLENGDFYSSTSDVGISEAYKVSVSDTDAVFMEKHHSLVVRAYFKIIAEAENADSRLKAEYERLNSGKQEMNKENDRASRNNLALVNKRYHAHREMLDGLKSWNIFSEYRSDDLDFFKGENVSDVHKMLQKGESDDKIISFLVYKLADLYHFED